VHLTNVYVIIILNYFLFYLLIVKVFKGVYVLGVKKTKKNQNLMTIVVIGSIVLHHENETLNCNKRTLNVNSEHD